jgi:hypothetical protein
MMNEQWFRDWALSRAQSIVIDEGFRLMDAAQWLDKKQTKARIFDLRAAIVTSLLEATQLSEAPFHSQSTTVCSTT